MTFKEPGKDSVLDKSSKYVILPPEGGWGYVVTFSLFLFLSVSVVPFVAIGVIFGEFFASIGDETSGISITMAVFSATSSFAGLPANNLLKSMSCRQVGLIGAFLFFVGSVATIFVTSLVQIVISLGVIEGIGFGLMMPATFSCFNEYFDKKKNLMMSISQAFLIAVSCACPIITQLMIDYYGFRGTVAILSALSANCFFAMATLHPVEWHANKVKVLDTNETEDKKSDHDIKNDIDDGKKHVVLQVDEKPLLKRQAAAATEKENTETSKQRPSLVSIGSLAISVSKNLNKIHKESNPSGWKAIVKALDLELFKDPKYVNMCLGLALSFTCDLTFLSILPPLLANVGFSSSETMTILTVCFIGDLIGRILLSLASAVVMLRNRYLFLAGTMLSVVFRVAFVLNYSVIYTASVVGILGFLRAFIQTPLPLVVAEEYPQNFATAFSLYMVVVGIVSIVFGALVGIIKNLTQSDIAVTYLLTAGFLMCGIPWIIEMFYDKICHRKTEERV